jgi:predicted RNA-binding protein with PUA-like domain
MAWFLVKSEPSVWSWDQMKAAGKKGTHWNGVRNHQAAIHLKAMAIGDKCFFYHSNEERQIVGIVDVIKTAYPDPSDETGRFVMVDLRAVKALPNPVTLAAIKAEPRLGELSLVRQSRLSVMAIDDASAQLLLQMGGVSK